MTSSCPGRLVAVAAAVLAAALGLAACGPAAARQAPDDGRIQVVTSTDVWGSIVRAVGGRPVSITELIEGSGADPHGYRATALDAAEVSEADLVVYNGGGYDPFMPRLLAATEKPRPPRPHSVAAVEASGRATGNEHVWYDPASVARVAFAVADALGELRPAAAQTFRANAAALETKLHSLSGRIAAIAAEHAGTKVLTTSPLAHYLVSSAGLHSVTPPQFTEAVEEGTGIPILAQHHVKELLTRGKVDVMVENAQTVTPVIEKLDEIAGERNVPVVGLRETLPEGSHGYVAWMTGQVQALAGALDE